MYQIIISMFFRFRCPLDEEEYVEFSNLTQDKIIGTRGEIATVSILKFICNFKIIICHIMVILKLILAISK